MRLTEVHIARNERVLKIPRTRRRVALAEAQMQYDLIKSASQERGKEPRRVLTQGS